MIIFNVQMSIVQIQPWCHLAHATAIMRWRTSASLASPTCSLSASAMGRSGKLKSQ